MAAKIDNATARQIALVLTWLDKVQTSPRISAAGKHILIDVELWISSAGHTSFGSNEHFLIHLGELAG